ncbi:hypothetical protein TBLA_0F02150 [Henningerozyma blattae CBS 6284]|uniref:CHCH domain-containing protein n=1 Tax=Henningerozyma blattae (strain ATCC 34711 / CBS 6284 / DSM 70876 / NBRC 10599 / NRRL Y-10934 / UCD 77-7) TaxID=1071380 RepID=I2H5V5_HENB6|nr:hypothetical protein TBLA_0F02150 [Tetrapisispora blattae CBS 6284]CCH61757.1 hypothetical protein TBLA_0F02150 [Tetrapisispora blattae CBS 6284]
MSNINKSKYYNDALEEYKDMVSDTEKDNWDTRIDDTGCYIENLALQLCHAETNDWRKCMLEMQAFRRCWEIKGNRDRVPTIDRDDIPKSDSKFVTTSDILQTSLNPTTDMTSSEKK